MKSALAFVLLAACAADVPAVDVEDDPLPGADGKEDSATSPWTKVGFGVAYQRVNTGNAILIAYGGYTARLSYTTQWAQELVDQKLGAMNVGQIYAVQGPADPGYDAKEIGNSKIRAHLPTVDDGTSPIYVVAHSSGSYVAHELLSQLHRVNNTNVLGRIGYADLDGGGSGLTSTIVGQLRKMTFVYAHDPTLSDGYSENSSSAEALGEEYAPKATTFQVRVSETGCDDGAGWCLHDVVITHRPHHSWSFDLADDYTDFLHRPCTTEYIDNL